MDAKPISEEPATSAFAPGARLDGMRVLVVDDDADTHDLLKVALTKAGAEVKASISSAEDLSTFKTWKAGCIVSDIGMPGEDGYDLMKKVRELKKSGHLEI